MENYEQKHKEDLEAAKGWYKIAKDQNNQLAVEILETQFPELKESEDDRIRKSLIHILQVSGYMSPEDKEKAFAWLEKKGEKVDAIENFDTEFEKQVSHLIASAINKEHEYNRSYVKWTANALLNYAKHELEKQDEQKPADNVAPKVEIEKGKWYVCNISRYKDFVVGKAYYCPKNGMLKPNENAMARYVARNCFHLWTIQDAKDGDVLYCKKDDDIEIIVMYLGINIHNNVDSYCRYNSKLGFNIYITNVLDAEHDFITPATKEQCDLLFQKMREAGYEWDADKKELKKIEQKQDWSEEDEKMFNDAISLAYEVGDINMYNWLKSLKERMKGK